MERKNRSRTQKGSRKSGTPTPPDQKNDGGDCEDDQRNHDRKLDALVPTGWGDPGAHSEHHGARRRVPRSVEHGYGDRMGSVDEAIEAMGGRCGWEGDRLPAVHKDRDVIDPGHGIRRSPTYHRRGRAQNSPVRGGSDGN